MKNTRYKWFSDYSYNLFLTKKVIEVDNKTPGNSS